MQKNLLRASLALTLFLVACKGDDSESQKPPHSAQSERRGGASSRVVISGEERLKNFSLDLERLAGLAREDVKNELRARALDLAEEDLGLAVRFLVDAVSFQSYAQEVLNEMAGKWFMESPDLLREALLEFSAEEGKGPYLHHLVRAAMEFPKDSKGAALRLDFVATFTDPEIVGQSLEALALQEHRMGEEDFTRLRAAFTERLSDEDFQKFLPVFGEVLAKRDTETLRMVIEEMPSGLYANSLVERAFAELGRANPEVGTQWLSEEGTFELLAKPSETERRNSEQIMAEGGPNAQYMMEMLKRQQEYRYDKVVMEFIYALSDKYPDDALEATGVIHDLEQRAKVESIIRQKMAYQNQGSRSE